MWVLQNLLFCSATTFLLRKQFPCCEKLPKCAHPSEVKRLLWWSLTWTILSLLPHEPSPNWPCHLPQRGSLSPHPNSTISTISFLQLSGRNLETSASPLSLCSPSCSALGSQWYCMWTWFSHHVSDLQFHSLSKVIGGILSVMIFLGFLSWTLLCPRPNMLGDLSVQRSSFSS